MRTFLLHYDNFPPHVLTHPFGSDKFIATNYAEADMGLRTEPGDNVRVKAAEHRGARGVVEAVKDGVLLVRLENSATMLRLTAKAVTNLSLAARKAWQRFPTRRVGRPKGLRFSDRVSVTLRIDRDLWQDFQEKESLGAIEDRTALINEILREKLAELDRVEA
jgi:uncharacterized protein (DUF4415 family)